MQPSIEMYTPIKTIFPSVQTITPQSGLNSNPSNASDNFSNSFTQKARISGEIKGQTLLSLPICNYCKQSGNIISECIALKRKREKEKQGSPKPTGLSSLRLKPQSSIHDENPILAKISETVAVMEI